MQRQRRDLAVRRPREGVAEDAASQRPCAGTESRRPCTARRAGDPARCGALRDRDSRRRCGEWGGDGREKDLNG